MRFLSKNFRVFLTVLAALALAAILPAQAQNLFEADWSIFYSGNNIYQFTSDGAKTTFASGVFQAVGLAFDSSSNLFVANGVVGTITKITPNGTQSKIVSERRLTSSSMLQVCSLTNCRMTSSTAIR
jgi:hypothetical protein